MIELYDTTLRDGTQQEGISLTVADKLAVAQIIDSLGFTWIEGGWPGANPKDTEFFAAVAAGDIELTHSGLVAFGMTRRPGVEAAHDDLLNALLEARTAAITLVGKSDIKHVTQALGTTAQENIDMVASSVAYLVGEGRRVLLDAEHFFDGYRRDPAYALDVLEAAVQAGAAGVVLCDTNGGTLPTEINQIVKAVRPRVGEDRILGIHAHDDTGCAVANSLLALDAGANHVQGTINGIGERTGNANICTILPNLAIKQGLPVVDPELLTHLTLASHQVAEIMNLNLSSKAPWVGGSAFAHKAGLHASALAKNPDLYQHTDPALVGNQLRMLVSELAGRSNVLMKGDELGLDMDKDTANRVLARVKELEHKGYSFEAADASFELLVRRENGEEVGPFELESWRTLVEHREDGKVVAEATVKVHVGGERLIGTAEGNGPVDALDQAFRVAVGQRIDLSHLALTDYKVRIIDPAAATQAITRVAIDATDGEREFTTVGVGTNIIEASWMALVDTYEFHNLPARPAR